jgi:hypothetical protein
MTISMTTAVRNARGDAVTTATGNAALMRVYDGTPPASANAALSGNTKLSEQVCGSPFAAAASGAVLTANAIANDASADATGTASFFRLYKADGTTVIMQGTFGTSGTDMIGNTTAFVSGGPVAISSFALTEGNA